MNDRQQRRNRGPANSAHFADDASVLMRYLDGESGRGERMRINAHLLTCPSCSRDVRAYRALGLAVAQLPARKVRRELTQRILMSVEADRRLRTRAHRHWLEWAGAAYAFSAVGFLLVVGLSPWREGLVRALQTVGSDLLSGSIGAVVGAFDRFVFLLDAAVRLGEATRSVLGPLAPLWRSLQVLAAQPELRVGLACALVLSTVLVWFLDQRRVRDSGRMSDAHAFL
jgi:predicted anti-sigma-YlaC factor YlaD